MTGFGVGAAPLGGGRVVVEARAVNHRYLDLRVRVPRELADHAMYLEQVARARLTRGRVELAVHAEALPPPAHGFDRARALAAMRSFGDVAKELGLEGPAPISLLGSVPDLFVAEGSYDPEPARAALREALDVALAGMDSMRRAEGAHLAGELRAMLDRVIEGLDALASHAEGMTARYMARARQRVLALLGGARPEVDGARLEQELATLAERGDVAEEVARLRSHASQAAALFGRDEGVGRRLDFILQEMLREANTVGAKSTDAAVSSSVVALKSELERMREQAQNIE